MGSCETKLWLVVFFVLSLTKYMQQVEGKPEVPCLFIFGDSLSDSGNNNQLPTDAKVNYYPYGIDFPAGPTGRFTNGLTAADIITQLLGFDNFIPPFANTSGADIIEGVNYASGGAGIRKETGIHLGQEVCLAKQLENHKVIVSKISEKLRSAEQVQNHLNKCLYYVNIGSNDYLNNYFLPEHYSSSKTYAPNQYAQALVQEYSMGLKALHDLGARKFALIGLNFLGCVPHEVATHGKNGTICVEDESAAAILFNDNLRTLVDQFNEDFSDSKFIFVNTALITSTDPKIQELNNNNTVGGIVKCCDVGSNGQCLHNKDPCKHRNRHVFFDGFHPTEIINQVYAICSYNSPILTYTHPMDISHLVKL